MQVLYFPKKGGEYSGQLLIIQNLFLIVSSVASYRPHHSQFWANVIFLSQLSQFLFVHLSHDNISYRSSCIAS